MCVQTRGLAWERPVHPNDFPVIHKHFAGVPYQELFEVMSRDAARPLVADLVLYGAMNATKSCPLGMRYVPFSGHNLRNGNNVKLPVMEHVVDWFENTALGTDMWNEASDWSEKFNGTRVHFAMKCGCGLVATSGYRDGTWARWKQEFNILRENSYGKTHLEIRTSNDISDLDITEAQLTIWHRIRACLEEIGYCATDRVCAPSVQANSAALAA